MKYFIEKTSHNPSIKFENDTLEISGRSIPEDSTKLYDPIINIILEYSKTPLPLTKANFYLEYSNSSSNRSIMSILEILEDLYSNGYNVIINWYYVQGDLEMLTLGEDFKSLLKLPFNLKDVESF
jgi:hypothetical protein